MRPAARHSIHGALLLPAILMAAACTDSFLPQFVDTIDLRPDSVHLEPGEVGTIQAVPLSDRGDELLDRASRVEWTVVSPGVAEVEITDTGVRITGQVVGSTLLTASLGRGTTQGRAHVHPPGLDRIAVDPPAFDVAPGTRPIARALLFDANGDLLSPEGFRISWEFADESIGFVGTTTGPQVDLLARRVGETRLKLIVNDMATGVPFVVR